MKKYRNIIIAFIIGVLACFIVLVGIKISKKKQIKKYKIEHRMKNDTIHTDSAKKATIEIWREKRKAKRDSIK